MRAWIGGGLAAALLLAAAGLLSGGHAEAQSGLTVAITPSSGSQVPSGIDDEIVIVVRDAAGELVGSTPVTVVNVSGPATLGNATNEVATTNTVGGVARFAYNTGKGPASIVFGISVGEPVAVLTTLALAVAPEAGAAPPNLNVTVTPESHTLIEPKSEISITVVVTDDQGLLVGPTMVTIENLTGGGSLEGGAATHAKTTLNGVATFAYTAPAEPAEATFHILVGASKPVARALHLRVDSQSTDDGATRWSDPIVGGWNRLTWTGRSSTAVADVVPSDVQSVWYWNGSGWNAWFADAAQTLPAANTLSTLRHGGEYWLLSSAGHSH